MNRLIFMKGYLINNPKYNVSRIQEELINSRICLLSIDNNGDFKTSNVEYINSSFIDDELGSLLQLSTYLNKYEKELLYDYNDKYMLWLYPIHIKYKNFEINANISLRLYLNNTIITTIEVDSEYDTKKLQKELYTSEFESICSSVELYNYIFENYNINSFNSLFDFVKVLLSGYFEMGDSITRNLFIVDKEKLNIKDIYKILNITEKDFKSYEELKDYRTLDDYYHYSSETSSLIYGSDINQPYMKVLILDYEIIYLILNDFVVYNTLKNDKLSLKELYKLRDDYLFKFATKKYNKYELENDYINDILNLENRYDLKDLISESINKKIEKRNDLFQKNITIITIVLTIFTFFNSAILDKIISMFKYILEYMLS